MRRHTWSGIALVFMATIWWGIPAVNKWRVDKAVDELCAKDGGIKVYEAVRLSEEKFNEFGEVYVPTKKNAKSMDEYYYTNETTWIIPEGKQVRDIDLRRYHDRLFRAKDGKLLAEGVGYSRRGGDAVGPWHPSHYACPAQSDEKYINQKVFIHELGAKK